MGPEPTAIAILVHARPTIARAPPGARRRPRRAGRSRSRSPGASRRAVRRRGADHAGHRHLRPARRRLARPDGGPAAPSSPSRRPWPGRWTGAIPSPSGSARRAAHAQRTYTVTVATASRRWTGAGCASRTASRFRVRGPRVLAGSPVGTQRRRALTCRPTRGSTWWSTRRWTPPSVARGRVPRVRPAVQPARRRPARRSKASGAIAADDRWDFREAGGWDRDRSADPLRRVVRLRPAAPLPHGCAGELVVPAAFDERGAARACSAGGSPPTATSASARAALRLGRRRSAPPGRSSLTLQHPGARAPRCGATSRSGRRCRSRLATPPTSAPSGCWTPTWRRGPPTPSWPTAHCADGFGQALTGNPVATITTTGLRARHQLRSGPRRRGAEGRRHVRPHLRQCRHARGGDRAGARLARGRLPRPQRVELERALARAPAQGAARPDRRSPSARDRVRVYGVKLAAPAYRRPGTPTLLAVQVTSRRLDSLSRRQRPIALLQVTDLGVHARIGSEDGVVWVTGASDGAAPGGRRGRAARREGPDRRPGGDRYERPRPAHRLPSPTVRAVERRGRGRTRSYQLSGLRERGAGDRPRAARHQRLRPRPESRGGSTSARPGARRACPWPARCSPSAASTVPASRCSPRRSSAPARWARSRRPAAGDSLRWVFEARADGNGPPGALRDTDGGALRLRHRRPALHHARGGAARRVSRDGPAPARGGAGPRSRRTGYRVAEYRPPEFLVDVTADTAAAIRRRFGDRASVEARYLFGAPMGRAARPLDAAAAERLAGRARDPRHRRLSTSARPAGGTRRWASRARRCRSRPAASTPSTPRAACRSGSSWARRERGRPSRATLEATVVDVNRQTVSASASLLVHPADFYLGAKPEGDELLLVGGHAGHGSAVIAVRPDGGRVPGVRVTGTIVRREWHSVRRDRDGYGELVGEWVSDTVARCAAHHRGRAGALRLHAAGRRHLHRAASARPTPPAGSVAPASTAGPPGKDWVPWNDESQFKMDVDPRPDPLHASATPRRCCSPRRSPTPRRGSRWSARACSQQRRLTITSGTTTLKLPITEALAPNAFVSIIVARGRSAPPGPLDDPGRPTIRVGYAELRVTPERKRLTVEVAPLAAGVPPRRHGTGVAPGARRRGQRASGAR